MKSTVSLIYIIIYSVFVLWALEPTSSSLLLIIVPLAYAFVKVYITAPNLLIFNEVEFKKIKQKYPDDFRLSDDIDSKSQYLTDGVLGAATLHFLSFSFKSVITTVILVLLSLVYAGISYDSSFSISRIFKDFDSLEKTEQTEYYIELLSDQVVINFNFLTPIENIIFSISIIALILGHIWHEKSKNLEVYKLYIQAYIFDKSKAV